jgi:hypothetical protein
VLLGGLKGGGIVVDDALGGSVGAVGVAHDALGGSVTAVGVAPDAQLLGRALGHEPRGDGKGEASGVGGEDAGGGDPCLRVWDGGEDVGEGVVFTPNRSASG